MSEIIYEISLYEIIERRMNNLKVSEPYKR